MQISRLRDAVLDEPALQCRESLAVIAETAGVASRTRLQGAQVDFEVAFGDVYAQSMSRCIHSLLMITVMRWRTGSPMKLVWSL